MKKLLFLLIILLGGVSGCKNDNCTPDSFVSLWKPEKTISYDYNEEFSLHHYNVVDGESIVFIYNHTGAQCNDVYDDEWSEQLVFELAETDATEFEFLDEEILSTNCFYEQYGAWVNHQYQVKEGSIKGQLRTDNSWKITVSIQTRQEGEEGSDKTIEFTRIFRKN